MAVERIQKLLAAAGYGSRRACEDLVTAGRVGVNGETTRTLPVLIDPEKDSVTVDGRPVRAEARVYYLLNKPRNVFCTNNDPAGRMRAVDLLKGVRERVFPVGRLDAESTGLLLLTNDGELAQKLAHPRYGAPKTYRVEVAGCPTGETLEKLRAGVWLSEGKTAPAKIEFIHRQKDRAILEITICEARNREIRRMLARFGHNVRRLHRIRMGKLSVAKLPVGAYRKLTPAEVSFLHSLADRPAEIERPSGRAYRSTGRTAAPRAHKHRESKMPRETTRPKGRRIIP